MKQLLTIIVHLTVRSGDHCNEIVSQFKACRGVGRANTKYCAKENEL